MFYVSNYTFAVVLCVVCMFCWGSWGNTQKLAGKTCAEAIAFAQKAAAISVTRPGAQSSVPCRSEVEG